MTGPVPIGSLPPVGSVPQKMFAQVVRQDRFGDPRTAFQVEEIDVPPLKPHEVLIAVMAAGINQAVSEALAFAAALELPLEKVIDVVGSGAAGNWFLAHRGPTMTHGNYEPGFRVALHHKDLAICRQMAANFGVALPVVEMTLIHYRRLMEAGLGDLDISALHHEKQGLFSRGDKSG